MSGDDLVEVGDFSSLPEAEIAKGLLENFGVSAFVSTPGGFRPELGFTDGYRVKVKERDLQKAKDILKAKFIVPD